MKQVTVCTLGFVLLVGCGSDDPPPVFIPDVGTRDGGADGGVDLSMDQTMPVDMAPDIPADAQVIAACDDPLGPVVSLTSPVAAPSPSDPNVLVDARPTVRCEVMRSSEDGSAPLDPDSVVIARVTADGVVLDAPTVVSEGAEYRAQFDLTGLPNGEVRFLCTAQDDMERCQRSDVATLLDLGPNVEITTPSAGSVHTTSMGLRFVVTEAPVADGDTAAAVASQTVTVAGVALTELTDEGEGAFSVNVDFEDEELFDPELSGDFEIVIEATNRRAPTAATRRVSQPFVLDRTAPSIVFITPGDGDLIGGRTRVAVTITDPSGVDAATVVLRVGGRDFDMRPTDTDDEFEVFFDASEFPATVTELTLNVTAFDTAGNRQTESQVVKLDSVPPIASLDPPSIREGRVNSGSGALECSPLFDPVGADSVNDGQVVGTAAEFRARVEDETNRAFGGEGTVLFVSGIESVELYLRHDDGTPLLIDTDEDGVCDSINPLVEPDPGDPTTATVLDLIGLRTSGTVGFETSATFPDDGPLPAGEPESAYDAIYDTCTPASSPGNPRALCAESSPLTRLIETSYGEEAIYVKGPTTPLTCVGDLFDFQGSLEEGWACTAIRAEDRLGNAGISPPLRACFIDGVGEDPCPGTLGTIAPEAMRPSCTDGCTLPRSFVDDTSYQLFVAPR
ncbi:MAG: hypothetical protein AAF411_05535 [Myxococcota bacterium]